MLHSRVFVTSPVYVGKERALSRRHCLAYTSPSKEWRVFPGKHEHEPSSRPYPTSPLAPPVHLFIRQHFALLISWNKLLMSYFH